MQKKLMLKNKILFGYEENDKKPSRFYIYRFPSWYRIDFKTNGIIKLKTMPKSYHFDFESQPFVEVT